MKGTEQAEFRFFCLGVGNQVGKKWADSNEENQKHEGDQNQELPEFTRYCCVPLIATGCIENVYVQYTVCVGAW